MKCQYCQTHIDPADRYVTVMGRPTCMACGRGEVAISAVAEPTPDSGWNDGPRVNLTASPPPAKNKHHRGPMYRRAMEVLRTYDPTPHTAVPVGRASRADQLRNIQARNKTIQAE